MNRALQWGLAATLMISGMVMLTACTANDDNSVPTTTEEDVTTYVASDYWATCQAAWQECRGWILLQSGLAPDVLRGEYRPAWSCGGTEPTPQGVEGQWVSGG